MLDPPALPQGNPASHTKIISAHLNQLRPSKRPNGQRLLLISGRPPRPTMAHRAKKVPVPGIGPTTRWHLAEINECHAIVRVQAVGCKSMNHAQRYLAQANRQIAELTVQLARQCVIVEQALDTGQRSEMRSRCLMRSKQAFAYSRGTGYFCSVATDHPPCRRVRPRADGACHDATGMDEPITRAASSWRRLL
jgi:hypothetical protein